MKLFPRRGALGLLLALPLLGACASDVCNQLAFTDEPGMSKPLVMPEGVAAIPEGGEFRIPDVDAAPAPEGCLAKPPMTLPPEALAEPDEDETGVDDEKSDTATRN